MVGRFSKRLLLFLPLCLGLCLGEMLRAETITYNNLTTPATIDGDRVIVNGSIIINTAGDLIIHGDLTIVSGSIYMGPNAGKLKVFGDLLITNTEPSGDASIITHDAIEVSGTILLRSRHGEARITTTGAEGTGALDAEQVITIGYGDSSVYTDGAINVTSGITTESIDSTAFVDANANNIRAGSINTYGYGHSHIDAGDIHVAGEINTISLAGWALVRTTDDDIYAGTITTSGYDIASVASNGHLEVLGTIKTWSKTSFASVRAPLNLIAGAVVTDGASHSHVEGEDLVDVMGDIITNSNSGWAFVASDGGPIIATNIVTNAFSDAYVSAHGMIDVRKDISTKSSNGFAYVSNSDDDIKAYSITTDGLNDSCVRAPSGSILTRGRIFTKSRDDNAYVRAYWGNIEAESIFTNGVSDSYVLNTGEYHLMVKDIIDAKSSSADAYVQSWGNVDCRSISTNGAGDSYVLSTNLDIIVAGDIRTISSGGDAYVKAPNGDINARSIKTVAPTGQDDSIKSSAGTGHFKLFPNVTDVALTIKDAEFNLDQDHVWNTQLSLEGTCTLNGNGYHLKFGDNGAFIVTSGASLLLKNIILDQIGGIAVRCADNTSTLSLYDTTMTLTADLLFENGVIEIFGDTVVRGRGTEFEYKSTGTSKVHDNSRWIFTDDVTLRYDTDTQTRITLLEDQSFIKFDNATLLCASDIRFTKGILTVENLVDFDVVSSEKIYFGDGVSSSNNLEFDFVLGSQFNVHGDNTLEKNNV